MNLTLKRVLVVPLTFMLGAAHGQQVWSAPVRINAGAAAHTGTGLGIQAVPGAGLGALTTPASNGGSAFSVLPGQNTLRSSLVLPQTPAVNPVISRPGSFRPALGLSQPEISVTVEVGRTASLTVKSAAGKALTRRGVAAQVSGRSKKTSVLQSITKFARGIVSPKSRGNGVQAAVSIRRYYDGSGVDESDSDVPVPAENASIPQASSLLPARKAVEQQGREDASVPKGVTFRALDDGSDIATFRPRVVFLTDIFDKPASAKTVAELQGLIDQGVHLVFMTWRPMSGSHSAKSVLLSKLKVAKDNPVTVVTGNGAQIASYATGAAPRVAANGVAFLPEEIDAFSAINGRIKTAMKLKAPLEVVASNKADRKGSYAVRIPGQTSGNQLAKTRSALIKRYNGALRSASLPYRMEAHPDDPRAIITFSQPLRFSFWKISEVLDLQFPGEGLSARGDEFLLVADTKRYTKLAGIFREESQPVNNAEIQHVASEAELQGMLAAAAGRSPLSPVDVNFYKVRQYADYWLPREKFLTSGARSNRKGGSGGAMDQKFALFSAKVINKLVATLYDRSFRGKTTTLKYLEARLEAMWEDPSANGVWIDKGMKRSMSTKTWQKLSNSYHLAARTFIRSIWFREFGDYAMGANEVMENLVSLGSDRLSVVEMRLRSPFTGQLYRMSAAPQRVMKLDSASGRTLTAYAIRTGKNQVPGPGDELQAKTLALATLIGYGRKGTDLQWHHGTPLGKPIAKIQVQFEYLRTARSWSFSPQELLEILDDGRIKQGKVADEIVRIVERERADHAYQRDYAKNNRVRKSAAAPTAKSEDLTALRALRAFFGRSGSDSTVKPLKSDIKAEPEVAPRARRQRTLLEKLGKKPSAPQKEDSGLATSYPRVVVILDIFDKPVSDQAAAYVQKLLDAGVRVVFMTSRPQKGPDSADEILLSRVKTGRTNPVIVVSHNGGRIAIHSRAKNPKPLLQDTKAFSAEDVKAFRDITGLVSAELGIEGTFEEEVLPDAKSAFSYSLTLPDSVPTSRKAEVLKAYNAALTEAGYDYRMQAVPADPRMIRMYTMPLRFSIGRVNEALDVLFKGDELPANPAKWLILADSQRSPKFSKAFPKKSEVQVVRSGADMERTLGAVLGDRKLDTVALKLGKLRQFVEFWEPRKEQLGGKSPSAGGASASKSQDEWAYDKAFAKFTGSVFYKLMPWIFEQIWRGQHSQTTLTQVETKLRQLWYNPIKNMVFISKTEAAMMNTPGGRKARREYFYYARAFLRNLWLREFSDYSEAALDVMENLVSLSSDRQSLITLPFKSKTTGKLYKIFTRVPVLMKHDTSEGRVLSVHAYRTGKERPNDGDELHAKILAMATIVAYGRKGLDGTWRHGWFLGPKIHKIHVRLEFRSAPRDLWFDPSDLLELEDSGKVSQGEIVVEITSAIERMQADEEYEEYYKEHEKPASEEDLKPQKDTEKPARKTKKPAKRKGGKR